jgi:hypothetical protein
MSILTALTNPIILYSRSDVLSKPSPVPNERGLYSWFFKEVPPGVPTDGCYTKDGLTMLYAGISPSRETSKQSLRKRIKRHYQGPAYGSTLRLTLGTLLAEQSDFPMLEVANDRLTLTRLGEQRLDDWMEENAFVCWVENSEPWEKERGIIEKVSLPLNIRDNDHHPFAAELSELRSEAKKNAIRDDGIFDELLKGNWMEHPRADGSLGHILYREGFGAVVIPSDKGDYPWEWHIGKSISGGADTPEDGMEEIDDIIEKLVELRKDGKLLDTPPR